MTAITVGPVIEAFGFSRIIFGSGSASATDTPSNAGEWYALAKESITELGVEQEDVDAVFGGNAARVYAA
jgi:predicted TIM-barrel fold metal-dependent hydrolase